MSYRWVDHTAELELHIEAPSEPGIFGEALSALAEVIGDERAGEPVSRAVTLSARDRAALLAAWIDELVYLAETEGLVPDGLESLELAGERLSACVRAHRGEPRQLVKGATYHRLDLARADGGFRATVVLDV